MRRPIALILCAMVLVACGGVAPSPPLSSGPLPGATKSGAPADATVTPVPTSPPGTPHPSPVALLEPGVLDANLTPWPVASISAGRSVCAVGTDAGLRCWPSAVEPPRGTFAAVEAGHGTSCGIRTDGSVTCWGDTQLPVPEGTFTAISVEYDHACGIRTDGTVHCWQAEENESGAPADWGGDPDLPPGRYTQLSVSGEGSRCALRVDGTVACWGSEYENPPKPPGRFVSIGDGCGVTEAGEIACFVGAEWLAEGPAAELPPGPFVAMDGSSNRGCALRESGAVACWGALGMNDAGEDLPMRTPPGSYVAVTVGEELACAQRADARAVCWGQNVEAGRAAPTAVVEAPLIVLDSDIPVSWSAVPVSAPITDYDVQYSSHVEGAEGDSVEPEWLPLREGTTKVSATLNGEDGGRYCMRARARDADGLVSDWSYGSCTVVPVDDLALEATGDWALVRGGSYFRGSALRTTTRGATLLISQDEVSSLFIVGTTCAACGTFVLRFPDASCLEESELASPLASCLTREEIVEMRGPPNDPGVVFAGNNGQSGFPGPLELVVTSSGKPVTIDGVIFADTE